jgi:hypothetical protein
MHDCHAAEKHCGRSGRGKNLHENFLVCGRLPLPVFITEAHTKIMKLNENAMSVVNRDQVGKSEDVAIARPARWKIALGSP